MVIRLIETVDSSIDHIEGKEVILILGPTDAGKTTTIHYLKGSKFQKQFIN